MNEEFMGAILEMVIGFAFAGAGLAVMLLTAHAIVSAAFWIIRIFKRAMYRTRLNRHTAELQKREKRIEQMLRILKDEK